jgi:hypothetical protein
MQVSNGSNGRDYAGHALNDLRYWLDKMNLGTYGCFSSRINRLSGIIQIEERRVSAVRPPPERTRTFAPSRNLDMFSIFVSVYCRQIT